MFMTQIELMLIQAVAYTVQNLNNMKSWESWTIGELKG